MKVTITPASALEHLDEVAAKYQGTRGDHQVLQGSLAVLGNVVKEWTAFHEEKNKPKVVEIKPDPEAAETAEE